MTYVTKEQISTHESNGYLAPPPTYEDATSDDDSSSYATDDDSLDRSYSGIPHDPATRDGLPLPVVIPQTTVVKKGTAGSPFMRAWATELQAHGLQKEDFITFIDGLNECFVPHPVFSKLNIAGNIMNQAGQAFFPVQLAGIGLQVAAKTAGGTTSYFRTRQYVKTINESYFHPAGLHVHVFSTEKMTAKVGYPQERLELPPLEYNTTPASTNGLDPREASQIAAAEIVKQNNPRLRRLKALEGYVLPLDTDVPEPVAPDNLLKRMSAAHAAKLERKQIRKMEKSHAKALRKNSGSKGDAKLERLESRLEVTVLELERRKSADAPGPGESLIGLERERAKLSRQLEKKRAKQERKASKNGSKGGKREKKGSKLERKEEKTVNSIKWIVIVRRKDEEDSDEDSFPEMEEEAVPRDEKVQQ